MIHPEVKVFYFSFFLIIKVTIRIFDNQTLFLRPYSKITVSMIENYKQLVENAWETRSLLEKSETQDAIRQCIELTVTLIRHIMDWPQTTRSTQSSWIHLGQHLLSAGHRPLYSRHPV